jgi:hypothetical protein
MKNTLTNFLIRTIGAIKRSIRRRKVFRQQHSKAILYTTLSTVSLIAVTIIIVLINGSNLKFPELPKRTPKVEASPTPLPSPTSAPVSHIYDEAPLIVLDCSELNDNGFIYQTVSSFGQQNDLKSQYIKVSQNDFLKTYKSMTEANNTPSVIIAPSHLIGKLGELHNISNVGQEVLFNKVAQGALKEDKIPLALSMYGYFFRTDLLYIMSQDIPRTYHDLSGIAESMRSDKAYKYLSTKEHDNNKKSKLSLFETSRYGFGFSGSDIAGELFIEQAMTEQINDKNILNDIKFMWDEIYLPPDTVYSLDSNIEKSFLNDGLCSAFAPGTLYEKLTERNDMDFSIKPYIGSRPIYCTNVIYCAVPKNSNLETATNFLSMLYNGGTLDKIIVQNHTAFLPVSNFYNENSPWIGAFNQQSEIIYYENDVYLSVLKHIILAGEDIKKAIEITQK